MSAAVINAPKRWTEGLTPYHYLVLGLAACGWLFDTMDQWLWVLAKKSALLSLIGSAADHEPAWLHGLSTFFGMTAASNIDQQVGNVQSVFILGWATGGLLFGMIGDRLGRTRTMAVTILIYTVFTGLSGLAYNWFDFTIYRFLTGLGIGGEFAAGASLVAEVFPEHARTRALGLLQACSAIGNMMAGFIGLGIATSMTNPDTWRYMFLAGFAPAMLVFFILSRVKEPEQWLRARDAAARGEAKMGSIVELFREPELRRRTIVGICLAAVGVIGFWGIGTFSPELIGHAINPANDPALKQWADQWKSIGVIAQNFGSFFGMLGFALISERIGRKPTFAMAFIACTFMVPLTFHLLQSPLTLLLLLPLMGLTTSTLFGGYAVYFPELFPTRLRATGTGFCYNVARYIAILGPAAFGKLSASYGLATAATILSTVFVVGLLALPFAPETKGRPLPE